MEKLSFVIPCYGSEATIARVVAEIRVTMATRSFLDYEVLLVNDASPDQVWEQIELLTQEDFRVKGVNLAKNFGQHSALMAGYAQASGDYVVSLDDDGQTPASEVFKLLDKLKEGHDVVYGYYTHAKEHWFRRLGSYFNKKMAESIIGQPKTLRTTSFFIAKRFIIEEIVKYPNPFPYISGLVFRVTHNLANVEVLHRHRLEGRSGYTFLGLISLWANGFTAFSVKPLRLATLIGVFCAFLGLISGLYLVIQKILNPEILLGYTSIMAVLLFVGGMLMLLLGLIGEYVGRIYICINQSPQYVVKQLLNFEKTDAS